MIKIHRCRDIRGNVGDLSVPGDCVHIDGEERLLALPALIDPHVHFRTPGHEYKENWESGSRAAIAGGVTTVFDMPNTNPPTSTKTRFEEKTRIIQEQLEKSGISLRHHLYFGADRNNITELPKVAEDVVGLKIFMGSSTGGLLMDDQKSLEQAFQVAAECDVIVAVHAECEEVLRKNKERFAGVEDPSFHPRIRSKEAAIKATEEALELAAKTGARLIVLHISTGEEIALIRQARQSGVKVFAETTPHHLYLTEQAYGDIGTLAQMNPPIRSQEDQEAIWDAVQNGGIDTIGTDHAPHTLEEKKQPYGKAPSGVPGIETLLPLLLHACNEGKLSLQRMVQLTRDNIMAIYGLEPNEDWVIVDLDSVKTVEPGRLFTRAGWSPFSGFELKGWPVYTILRGKIYDCETAKCLESNSLFTI